MTVTRTTSACLSALLLLLAISAATAARPGQDFTAVAQGSRQLLQDLQQQCIDAFNSYGGSEGIRQRVPSCEQDNFQLQQCCDETKSALSLGPEGCLCDGTVWSTVESQMTSAGIQGLTPETLKTFTNACNIPNYGAGTC